MADAKQNKGISLFALIAMVISSAIGAGIFDLPTTLARAATPGVTLITWGITAVGIMALAISLKNLVLNKPELEGVSDYARAGFGDFTGFVSGWGYWLSAWLGNIAFATMMMSAVGYFVPSFHSGNSLGAVFVASILSWLLTWFVVQGVESAAAINAIVTVCKLVPLAAFALMAAISFKVGIFTAHFWENFSVNTAGMFSYSHLTFDGFVSQMKGCLMAMMWVFVGIEGASMVAARAKKKSDAGKATIVGLLTLLFIYVFLTMLPYGYLSQAELVKIKSPAILYLFESMTGTIGGAVISIGMIITIFGAWLSWTILPSEATSLMTKQKILPEWFGYMNKNNAPSHSLWLTQIFIQIFLISILFTDQAYTFAYSLCTSAIVVCYVLVGAYQLKLGIQEKNVAWIIAGFIALAFQVMAVVLAGLTYLWLSMVIYAIGLVFYYRARHDYGYQISRFEKVLSAVMILAAISAIVALVTGVITI
ncbi:amino acid permease [Weissella diestrammenae]|uniref:Amino acid permease n=1 Tax=Weissella diestrammenae TaxID=1162633 RepID=A0A7G9T7K3_9LACO|nr:basic amino acid/polyamine antiporter [Weissella diestrammenae]MCM0581998.1 amino acid permease [Weissella diestrammenae]QNN76078.1 amino acid permease [Weissella diestrammenae]